MVGEEMNRLVVEVMNRLEVVVVGLNNDKQAGEVENVVGVGVNVVGVGVNDEVVVENVEEEVVNYTCKDLVEVETLQVEVVVGMMLVEEVEVNLVGVAV